jgi:hypothetical protein
LEFFASEHQRAEERAAAAEKQARASAYRIQQLLEQVRARGDVPDAKLTLPKVWGAEFVDWCDNDLAGRVVLSSRARRGVRSPEFEDVELAARALVWLANDYRDARLGIVDSPITESVHEGIWKTRCGDDEFEIDWQGGRHIVDWHIKNGGNTGIQNVFKDLLFLGPSNAAGGYSGYA